MNKPFNKLGLSFDVSELRSLLLLCDMWGEYPQRGCDGSPHEEMTDIWVRFNDPKQFIDSGDWSTCCDPHISVWLKDIPIVKDICSALIGFTGGTQLGSVLITKLPPGGNILPHTDDNWHSNYYDKYFIPIQNNKGASFCFGSGYIMPNTGEVWAFRNDVEHWVNNDSNIDRIAMIINIRQSKYSKEGLCLSDTQQQR